KVVAKPPLEQRALLTGVLAQVDPTVRTEVLRSTLATFGDEDLIASNGSLGSHTRHAGDDAAQPAPAMRNGAGKRASRCAICHTPNRDRIDQALAASVSVREIEQQEGFSKSVVGRHLHHGREGGLSHLQSPLSGTADHTPPQGQSPQNVQLD